MKASLVSHYGEKSDRLALYLFRLQEILSKSLSIAFTPYAAEQIHATIIGLEALNSECRVGDAAVENPLQQRRRASPADILSFLRSTDLPSTEVQIGGYSLSRDYGFLSQGQHPCVRSSSIQHDLVVALGWPVSGENELDDFRRSFNQFNISHKWHRSDDDIDNDFYFVLGKINRQAVSDGLIVEVEQKVIKFMTDAEPLVLNVNAKTLSIVFYKNRELPPDSTVARAITDYSFTKDDFLACINS